MGRGTLEEVRDRLGDPRGGPRQVGGPSEKFETGRKLPGRCGTGWGTPGRSRMGRETLGEVRDGSGEPRGGLERVRAHSRRHGPVQGTLEEMRTVSGDLSRGPGRGWGLSRRSGTGWETLPETGMGL